MTRLKLDTDALGLSAVVERLTGARVKDCFKGGDIIYFIVAAGDLGKAVGKKGINVKRIQQELQKRVKIIEHNEDVARFIQNLVYPLAINQVVEENGMIVIKDDNKKIKGQIIGRDGKNLEVIKRAVQRFFGKDVKVV